MPWWEDYIGREEDLLKLFKKQVKEAEVKDTVFELSSNMRKRADALRNIASNMERIEDRLGKLSSMKPTLVVFKGDREVDFPFEATTLGPEFELKISQTREKIINLIKELETERLRLTYEKFEKERMS